MGGFFPIRISVRTGVADKVMVGSGSRVSSLGGFEVVV